MQAAALVEAQAGSASASEDLSEPAGMQAAALVEAEMYVHSGLSQ